MIKLDAQNRIHIPKSLLSLCNTDFKSEIRLYINEDELFIDNPKDDYLDIPCFGKVNLDYKYRFFPSRPVREAFGLYADTKFAIYVKNSVITIKKI